MRLWKQAFWFARKRRGGLLDIELTASGETLDDFERLACCFGPVNAILNLLTAVIPAIELNAPFVPLMRQKCAIRATNPKPTGEKGSGRPVTHKILYGGRAIPGLHAMNLRAGSSCGS